MDKIWFILIEGKKYGPFSIEELKADVRITPDTLVWRDGFPNWVPIRAVKELKEVFEDEEESYALGEKPEKAKKAPVPGDELVLPYEGLPPSLLYWLLIICLIFLYLLIHFNWNR